MSDKIHAGLWLDCKNCNSDWKPKKRERKTTVRFSGEMTLEILMYQVNRNSNAGENKNGRTNEVGRLL